MKSSIGDMRLISTVLLLYWLALFAGTHMPAGEPSAVVMSDKLLHFGAYAGLGLLLAALAARGQPLDQTTALVVLVLAGGYGVADELLQALVPSRTPDFYDWVADMVGVLAGMAVYVASHLVVTATGIVPQRK